MPGIKDPGVDNQVILSYITSDLKDILNTDIFIGEKESYFTKTGLRSSSVLKLHRLITTTPSQIGEVIGTLPDELISEMKKKEYIQIKIYSLMQLAL